MQVTIALLLWLVRIKSMRRMGLFQLLGTVPCLQRLCVWLLKGKGHTVCADSLWNLWRLDKRKKWHSFSHSHLKERGVHRAG